MVPPGDLRNCLLALASSEPLWQQLLAYRFEESDLEGHNFGNLLIAALTRVTGGFDTAIRELNRLLQVEGQVLPATGQKVSLIARHSDGSTSTGEVEISASDRPIERVEMRPRVSEAAPDIEEALETAELMVFGPGSLFTSVIPPLLVDGIRKRVIANDCEKVYVANVMTQPGETGGMDLPAHVDALERHLGRGVITSVLAHRGEIPPRLLDLYGEQGSSPVLGAEELVSSGLRVIEEDLVDAEASTIRHHSGRLGRALISNLLQAGRQKI